MPALTAEEKKSLPTAVVKQIEREERAEKKAMADAKAAEEQTSDTPTDVPEEPPVEEPPPEPTPPVLDPTPPPPPDIEDTAGQTDYAKLQAEMKSLQGRYDTLKGKYNAEVPRFIAEAKDLREQLANRMAALEQKISEPQTPAEPEVPAHLKYLSEEEREDVLDDGESVYLKQAKGLVDSSFGTVSESMKALEAKLDSLMKEKEQSQTTSRMDTVWRAVEERVPGARDINSEYVFQEWLANEDPDSAIGATYLDKAERAFEIGDAATVASVIRQGADAVGISVEAGAGPTPPVKPTRSKGASAPPQSSTGRNVPIAEIKRFFHLRNTKGLHHVNGAPWTEAEIAAKEKEYDLAMDEGRIID